MKIKFTLVTIALIIMAILAFYIGHFPITKEQYMQILSFSQDSSLESIKTILYEVRFPRILSAIIVGASLSVAGAVYQGVFVNPLVSPGILGVLSGASFGAAIGMMIGQNLFFIQIFAFIFGFIAVILALILARLYGKSNTILMLVLGGVISSSLFGSLLSLIKYVADPYNTLPSIVYWLMGSFASTSLSQALTILPIMLFSIIILTLFSKHINILSLGDDDAKTLGVDVDRKSVV